MAFAVDNRKIAKNTVALYIRTAITMVIGFFTARITLQLLGSDDYGLNNLVGGVVSLFSFLNASMGTAVQRFFNIEMGKGNKDANCPEKMPVRDTYHADAHRRRCRRSGRNGCGRGPDRDERHDLLYLCL